MFSPECLHDLHHKCNGTRLNVEIKGYQGSLTTVERKPCTCKCHK